MTRQYKNNEAIQFIRRRKSEIFDEGVPSGNVIASNIAFGAAVLGAGHIELKNEGNWWFLASEFNWLQPNQHYKEIDSLFTRLVPFPEQSPSSYRSEIYITAFCDTAYVFEKKSSELRYSVNIEEIDTSKLPHHGIIPSWCTTVLAFHIEE